MTLDETLSAIRVWQAMRREPCTRFQWDEGLEAVLYARTKLDYKAGIRYISMRYGLPRGLTRQLYKVVCEFFEFDDMFYVNARQPFPIANWD